MMSIKIGVIGGTGLAEALLSEAPTMRHEVQTPFGEPSGPILEGQWEKMPVLILPRHGNGHVFSPTHVPYRANIYALKMLGCTHILASGAVGSLRQEFRPRDLVIADQVIDKTTRREASFFDRAAVHVEMSEPFCPVLRSLLLEVAKDQPQGGAAVHDRGCYLCMEGPAFSTRAESLMHRLWGADLVGMTAMPEAKLAREAQMPYALIGLVTDYDCWRNASGEQPTLLGEITANLQAAAEAGRELIRRALHLMADRAAALQQCPARHALAHALWSDPAALDERHNKVLAILRGEK